MNINPIELSHVNGEGVGRPDLQVMLVNVLKGNETAQREGGLDIHLLAREPGIEISGIWNFNGWVERWGKHRWEIGRAHV